MGLNPRQRTEEGWEGNAAVECRTADKCSSSNERRRCETHHPVQFCNGAFPPRGVGRALHAVSGGSRWQSASDDGRRHGRRVGIICVHTAQWYFGSDSWRAPFTRNTSELDSFLSQPHAIAISIAIGLHLLAACVPLLPFLFFFLREKTTLCVSLRLERGSRNSPSLSRRSFDPPLLVPPVGICFCFCLLFISLSLVSPLQGCVILCQDVSPPQRPRGCPQEGIQAGRRCR